MFTGIIEEIGTISGITHGAKSCTPVAEPYAFIM